MNIVFFDIDGTLAKGTEIPASAVRALHQLRLNGSIIFICTGRPYHYAYRHFYRYANGFITNNGRYAHMGCCEVMVDEPLSEKMRDTIIQRVSKEACIHFLGVEHGYFIGDHAKYEEDKKKYPDGWLLYGDHPEIPVYSFDLSYEKVEQIHTLQAKLHDLCILNPHGPHPSCDVTVLCFDKGDAINQVAKVLGVPHENTYAFGDGKNDRCMLVKAGHGIAMGNGDPDTKAVAEYVTSSIDDDGVANGLRHYGLIP